MSTRHVPMLNSDLVLVLRDMADRVEVGDSFEGSIEYLMPVGKPNEPKPGSDWDKEDYSMVKAGYRIGNTMGQGGMRLIGELS